MKRIGQRSNLFGYMAAQSKATVDPITAFLVLLPQGVICQSDLNTRVVGSEAVFFVTDSLLLRNGVALYNGVSEPPIIQRRSEHSPNASCLSRS